MQVAFQRVRFEQIMDIEAFSVCFSIPPAYRHIMSLYVTRYTELERDHTPDHYPSFMIAGDERKVYLDLGVVEGTCMFCTANYVQTKETSNIDSFLIDSSCCLQEDYFLS